MQRRQFLRLSVSALAAGWVAGCTSRVSTHNTTAYGLRSSRDDANAWNASRRFIGTRFGNIAYADRGSGRAALFLPASRSTAFSGVAHLIACHPIVAALRPTRSVWVTPK